MSQPEFFYEVTIGLADDQYTRNEWDDLFGDLADWLHDRFCGRDHGPKGEDGVCARDFYLSGRVVESELEGD